jgi:hypothetical protein
MAVRAAGTLELVLKLGWFVPTIQPVAHRAVEAPAPQFLRLRLTEPYTRIAADY